MKIYFTHFEHFKEGTKIFFYNEHQLIKINRTFKKIALVFVKKIYFLFQENSQVEEKRYQINFRTNLFF